MSGFFRPRGFAAACLAFACLLASPAIAADGPAAPLAAQSMAIAALPGLTGVPLVDGSRGPTASPAAAPLYGAPIARPIAADAIRAAALDAILRTRPLNDLVLSFVDYGSQDDEQKCLAKAVYFEARGEKLEGQLAVAEVVLNRASSGLYPSTICGVVTQPAQFSFVRGGRLPDVDTASECWHNALAIADIARKHLSHQVAANVLWYHASYVAPAWGRLRTRIARIGTHIFYS